jgi:hypothetical protein
MRDDLHKYAGYALINVVSTFDTIKDHANFVDIIVDQDFFKHAIVVAKKSIRTLDEMVIDGMSDTTLCEAVKALKGAVATLEEVRASKGHTEDVVGQAPYKDSVLQSRVAFCKIITWVQDYTETHCGHSVFS